MCRWRCPSGSHSRIPAARPVSAGPAARTPGATASAPPQEPPPSSPFLACSSRTRAAFFMDMTHAVWKPRKALRARSSPWNFWAAGTSAAQPKSCSMPRCSRYSRCHAMESWPAASAGAAARRATDSSEARMSLMPSQKARSWSLVSSPLLWSSALGWNRRSSGAWGAGRVASTVTSRATFSRSSLRRWSFSTMAAPSSAPSEPWEARTRAGMPLSCSMAKSCSRPLDSRISRSQRPRSASAGVPALTPTARRSLAVSEVTSSRISSRMPESSARDTSPSLRRLAAGSYSRLPEAAGGARCRAHCTARVAACWQRIRNAWRACWSSRSCGKRFMTTGGLISHMPSLRSMPRDSMSSSWWWSMSPPMSSPSSTAWRAHRSIDSEVATMAMHALMKPRISSRGRGPLVRRGSLTGNRRSAAGRAAGMDSMWMRTVSSWLGACEARMAAAWEK
mmetsp:Transcript_26220/g.87857  ORF Transcript_26220/g.87857 Transcript_26220/m.87857 type:complete len:450 (-) Transcript_26220:354-1703(-)